MRVNKSKADVWGNTDLHRAATCKRDKRRLLRYIDTHCDLDAVGAFGIRPRLAALMSGNRTAAQYLAAAGARCELGPLNEASYRSLLCAAFALDHASTYQGTPLLLGACFVEGVYGAAHQMLTALQPGAAAPISVMQLTLLRVALQDAWRNHLFPCPGADELRRRAQHQPVVMATGWRGHVMSTVVSGDRAIELTLSGALRPHQRTRLLEGRQVYEALRAGRYSPQRPGWQAHLCKGWQALTSGLRCVPFPEALQPFEAPANRPNCAYISMLAAVWSVLALDALAGNAPLESVAPAFSYIRTYFLRALLKGYLQRHAPPAAEDADWLLAKRCATMLKLGGEPAYAEPWMDEIALRQHGS